MTKERYDRIEQWFLARPACLRLLKGLNRWLALTVYCVYPLLLAALALRGDSRFWRVLLVPATVFVLVTLLRKFYDRPRPYETLDIRPLIPRAKKGQSFPSRHAASVAVIAAAGFYVWLPLGIALSVITLLIVVIRPIAGIHFPADVIAGVLFSLLIACIGFWWIPPL